MKTRHKGLAGVIAAVGIFAIAAVASTSAKTSFPKDSVAAFRNHGYKIYKYRDDDLRLTMAIKASKVYVVTLKEHYSCAHAIGSSIPKREIKRSWGGASVRSPLKIKKGGYFGYVYSDDFGQFIHTELRGTIHKGTIRGWFSDDYYAVDESDGDEESCWSGKDSEHSKINFKAHLSG